MKHALFSLLFFFVFAGLEFSNAQVNTLDPGFNIQDVGNGYGAQNMITSTAIQSDGKIIIGGYFQAYNATLANRIARLTSDGLIDPSFNATVNNAILTLALQPDGKILIGGIFTTVNGVVRNRIARLNPDGSLDNSFNPGSGAPTDVSSVVIDSGGKILVGGDFSTINGVARNRIARLNPDGSVDASFNPGTGFNNRVNAITVQPNGKILVAGRYSQFNGSAQKCLSRLNNDGSLDPTLVIGTGTTGGASEIYVLTLQSDGKVLVGGDFTYYNGLIVKNLFRINPDGLIDNLFDIGTGPGPLFGSTIRAIKVQSDNKLIIGGDFTSFNGVAGRRYITRLNSDGTNDLSFITGAPFIGPTISVRNILIRSDGKIIIGGYFELSSPGESRSLTQIDQLGNRDLSFNPLTGIDEEIRAIAIQPDGKILIAGLFTKVNGVPRGHLARLNLDGTLDTSFDPGTGLINYDWIYSFLIQPDGKIIIAGGFVAYNSVPVNNILRLNPDGSIDPSFNSQVNNPVYSVTGQPDGKIVIGGVFSAVNGNPVESVARLNPDGSLDPTFNPGSGTWGVNDYVQSVTLQADGKLIVAGNFSSFNGVSNQGIIRLNSDGSADPGFNVGSFINGMINEAVIQPDGKILIGGSFTTYNGISRARVARLNSDGSLDNSFNPGSGLNNEVYSLTLQPNGKVLLGGLFTTCNGISRNYITRLNQDGTIDSDFNPGTGFLLQPAITGNVNKVFLQQDGKIIAAGRFLSYNGEGKYYLARILNCSPFTVSNAVTNASCFGESNGAVTTSVSGGIPPFSYLWTNGETTSSVQNVEAGNYSVTVSDLTGCYQISTGTVTEPALISSAFSVASCSPYTWNTQTYSQSGQFQQTFNSTNGCDSVVTINYTMLSDSIIDVQMVCDSLVWIDGITYYSSTNGPTFVLQNAAGCDSTVTLNLTIHHSNTGIDIQTVCDSLTWIDGMTYYSSTNTPTFVLQNAAGCDSTVTLHLTINHSTTGTDVQTSCDSYDWIDGNTYTSSTNTPTFTLQNATGCDSVVTLNLTIINSNTGTDVQTACDSYDWIDGNTYTSSTNTPTFTLQNSAGCDSIVTLHLTITNSTTGMDFQTACDSYAWIDGNTYTSSTNTPTFVLQNSAGCDSTVTLNLTIIPSLPLTVENVFVFPSDANTCVGEAAIDLSGNAPFELDFDNGSQVITSNGYSLVTGLCAGVHDLHVTDNCGDTLSTTVVIPVDSNYVFNNPFIDSLAQDSLGVTMTNCDIYYAGIDTAYIDSIWATGNTVNVIWNIVDSNGSNLDTTSYVLNNGNGVYWLQLSVFCPFKAIGEYFTVTEAIYFNNGTVSTAGLADIGKNFFAIYPNPTNDQVHISFSGSDAELTVYDVQGKMVLKDRIQNQEVISLQSFERGVYLFDFKNSQGHSVQRVIKQ